MYQRCEAAVKTLLPAGQVGTGGGFVLVGFLTSNLSLMSGKPTWDDKHPKAPCWLAQQEHKI